MKLLLIGNCQSGTIRDVLRIWLPRAEIDHVQATHADTAGRAEALAASIPGYDLVLTHPIERARFGPLRHAALRAAAHPNLHFIPPLSFGGFHPDHVSLGDAQGNLGGPMGESQSAIIAAGFVAGLAPERVARLFNSFVYARLGYFDEFALASQAFTAHLAGFGLDGAALLRHWQGRVFMHTVIHPKPFAIADLCHALLRRLGLIGEVPRELGDVLGDRLLPLPVWPVYPEIGRRLGVPGHLWFRGSIPIRGDRLLDVMDLPGVIDRSYAHFATMPERVAQAVAANRRAAAALALMREELVISR